MKFSEKEEINNLPDKYRPLGAWSYVGYQLLFMIPLVGLICIIVFSITSDNINRRSFARSYICSFIIGVIVTILIVVGVLYFNKYLLG